MLVTYCRVRRHLVMYDVSQARYLLKPSRPSTAKHHILTNHAALRQY